MRLLRRASAVLAWALSAYVVFVTVSPVHLRPQFGHPDIERGAAYLVVGALFALAYPGRLRILAPAMIIAACGLEAAQLLIPSRDARVHDALVKAICGVLGLVLATLGERLGRSVAART